VSQEVSQRTRARVELRQIGPREGARLVGGPGLCGERLCSTRFPSHENPITLRMAKDQDLPMNPGRITGLCGRLRCCLAFEHPIYRAFRDRAPAVGRTVATPRGPAVVRSFRVTEDAVMVRFDGEERDELVTLSELAARPAE
jgi:cell fate regulator YaaT (PSP1 superfamily)